MGASNRLQDLDPALLRPGRFDRQVLVAPPDLAGREEILRRPHARQAARRRRRPPLGREADRRADRRRPREHRQRGRDLRRSREPAVDPPVRLRGRDGARRRGPAAAPVVTEKEKRILAYHEAGHAVMSHLMGDLLPVQKVTIVSRGQALGYTLNLPDRGPLPAHAGGVHRPDEGLPRRSRRGAGRLRARHERRRERPREGDELARAMVFEYGMSEASSSRTMRADNYALSEETKRLRDQEQARLTDEAYEEAFRLLHEAPRLARPARRGAAREGDARPGRARLRCSSDVEAESRDSETVGTVRESLAADCSRVASAPRGAARDPSPRRRRRRSRRGGRHLRAALRRAARAPRRRCPTRASRRRRCGSATAASSSSPRSATRRPSAGSSPSAGPGCTTSPTRSTTSTRRSTSSQADGAELIDDGRGAGLFGLEVAFVHPDAVHGVLSEVVQRWLTSAFGSRSASTAAR